MLARVADSLYWMSRYFERAEHCARVLEANYNLMLNPSKPSREQRWHRITASLGFTGGSVGADPQMNVARLIGEAGNRASIVSCMTGARENASQIREQISSEMWERLNQLYHELTHSSARGGFDGDPLRLISAFREGAYKFHGVTEATINHDEGWHFIQLGKYMERACALSKLLDAHFSAAAGTDHLDWVGLLTSCSAFEAYCKVYTADLQEDRIAEFLLLNRELPYSVRYSAERMQTALSAIAEVTAARNTSAVDRIIGKLQSSLAYLQIDEIMSRELHGYLNGVIVQCHLLHGAVYEVFIDYPVESAFEA